MQCYIILYEQNGNFLIFTKCDRGYFFHGQNGQAGRLVANGQQLQGGGDFAFPGGALLNGEAPFEGCLREFQEECGSQIHFTYVNPQAQHILANLDTVVINGNEYAIAGSHINQVANNYHALYLEFAAADLEQILALILNTNLEEGVNAAVEVEDGNFGNYDAIFNYYPFCPPDNELRDADFWHIQNNINEIRALNQNVGVTDWYFDMIDYLANTILQAGIQY